MMEVLNAYAGIGGNRHLWPASWRVTAVEYDQRIAAEYARRYPLDTVVIADAHEFVITRAHEFDATWTSPPCPTHSRLAKVNHVRYGIPLAPDPRLWAEVEHLRNLGKPYVVENVHTYYEPPIAPDVVTARHYYWVSRPPALLTPLTGTRILRPATRSDDYADAYGLPRIPRGALADKGLAMRNAVVPIEGLEIATAAFTLDEPALT